MLVSSGISALQSTPIRSPLGIVPLFLHSCRKARWLFDLARLLFVLLYSCRKPSNDSSCWVMGVRSSRRSWLVISTSSPSTVSVVWLVFCLASAGLVDGNVSSTIRFFRTRTGGRAGLEAEEPPVPPSPVVPTPGASSSEDLPPPFLDLVLVILSM